MTPSEFKAWFDGFTEAFNGVPTKAQWTRVKERVAEIDGKAVTERIYLDRYWPSYPPYRSYPYWATFGAAQGVGAACVGAGAVGPIVTLTANNSVGPAQSFNSTTAMFALGQADAQALAA